MTLMILISGIALILITLWDAFETVILPRSVTRIWRLQRLINLAAWPVWSGLASRVKGAARRERYLGGYGPLSLIVAVALWAVMLVFGFAIVAYGLGSEWADAPPTFRTDLYVSGTTFFTLGLGDVTPGSRATRILTIVEAGTGFGFLAITIAYLPVLYQSFSRREVQITLLDAWAGSPPSAVELLKRLSANDAMGEVHQFLRDWEHWAGDVLESHISYPQLAYFRSQHQRQSWVSALTTILDVSALILSGVDGVSKWQARLTFAIARHAAVDLSQILNAPPRESARLSRDRCEAISATLSGVGLRVESSPEASERLLRYRNMYEPFVAGLAAALAMDLPPWIREKETRDNWQSSPRKDVEVHF